MSENAGIWPKLTRIVVLLLVLASLLGVAVWYLPLIKTNERMRSRILTLDTQIQKEQEHQRQLKGSIDSLGSDPKAVERRVRESMGWSKTGEVIFRFEAPATNRPAL